MEDMNKEVETDIIMCMGIETTEVMDMAITVQDERGNSNNPSTWDICINGR